MSEARIGRRLAVAGAALAVVASGFMTVAPASAASSTGGTLLFVTSADQLAHVDPARVYTGEDIAFLNSFLFRTLVSYKFSAGAAGYQLAPDLATNTGVPSNNAKTWKFTLKPGVKYETGAPITCADIKYAASREFATDVITDGPSYFIQYLNIPQNADGSSIYNGPYKKANQAAFDKAVTCSKDNRTVTFNLNKSVADFNYFGSYPAMAPVPAKSDTGDKYDLHPVASGPYKIQQYKIGDSLTLVRNKYWSKATDSVRTPYPDDVEMRFGIQSDVIDQMMKTDSIPNAANYDALQVQNVPGFFENPSTASRGILTMDPYSRYQAINVKALPCLVARKALFFAWDTQGIITANGGTKYYGVPGDNVIKPTLGTDYAPTKGNMHDANWKPTGNPDYAKSLLAQAKTTCPDVYTKLTSTGVSLDLPDRTSYRGWIPSITAAMKAAGIVMKFNLIPPGQYYPTVQNVTKQGDITRAGWGPDWANASTVIPPLFTKNGGFDLSQNWDDPAYPAFTKLVDKAMSTTNRSAQAGVWKQAAQYAMDQYWVLGVMFPKTNLSWGSGIGGVQWWGPQGTYLFGKMYIK